MLLDFLNEVEANEEVTVGGGGLLGHAYLRLFYHTAVEGTLVGQLLTMQPTVEVVVDVGKTAPQLEESLLELTVVAVGEIAEEVAQHVTLFVGEVRYVVKLVQVAQVGKHAVGVGHVLVDVVEVADEQLSPAVEAVERLSAARDAAERLVKVADELDAVGHLQFRLLSEQLADGDVGRTPQGAVGQTGQMLVEEQ